MGRGKERTRSKKIGTEWRKEEERRRKRGRGRRRG